MYRDKEALTKFAHDYLKEQDYQDIEIKQRQGKVRFVRSTTRKDFKRNG